MIMMADCEGAHLAASGRWIVIGLEDAIREAPVATRTQIFSRSRQALIQAALHGITASLWRGLGRSLRCRPRLRIARPWGDLGPLTVCNEFVVAWRSLTRRHTIRHPTRPVRPMVGDKAGKGAASRKRHRNGCNCGSNENFWLGPAPHAPLVQIMGVRFRHGDPSHLLRYRKSGLGAARGKGLRSCATQVDPPHPVRRRQTAATRANIV